MRESAWLGWVPGVLSKRQVKDLCDSDLIRDVQNPDASVDESSIDLSLSNQVYHLTEGSVKPFSHAPYFDTLRRRSLLEPVTPDKDIFVLKRLNTYLVRVREQLSRKLSNTRLFGQATAKSSIGRVDVLVRIIVDGMDGYDFYDSNRATEGEMFAEITPIGFNVCIRPGTALAQLRLFYGDPRSAEIRGSEIHRTCILDPGRTRSCSDAKTGSAGLLSVNLDPVPLGQQNISAFEGLPKDSNTLNLWREPDERDRPNPRDFFCPLEATKERLVLCPGSFYILRSRERLSLPPGIAVYIRAIDETLGEMRIHYAGFAHPRFGYVRDDSVLGTPLIFEVRGHDFPAVLLHGEKMARLTFYRMSEPAEEAEEKPSGYNTQELSLSSIFAKYPATSDSDT